MAVSYVEIASPTVSLQIQHTPLHRHFQQCELCRMCGQSFQFVDIWRAERESLILVRQPEQLFVIGDIG
jgi:hypothetical protein